MSQEKTFRLQGSIHDVQHLFLGFRAIMQLGSLADQKQAIVDVQREILSYNKELAERYNLPKPRDVGFSVAEDVVSVLKSIGLLEYQDHNVRLSTQGKQLASFLESSRTKEFRNELTRLILEKFPEIGEFLTFLNRSTISEELVLPKFTVELAKSVQWDPEAIADRIITSTSKCLREPSKSRLSKIELKKQLSFQRSLREGDGDKSLESMVDRYLITRLMSPFVTSKRKYDVIRDLSTSLFLVNSGSFKEGELSLEAVYSTSWLYPDMSPPANVHEFNELILTNGKTIKIHEPSLEAFEKELRRTVVEAYRNLEPEFGFVDISDLRDHVCRVLRISDRLFDTGIVRLYGKEPQGFGLSYSFKKVTSKRLPILIGDTLKTSYNLIRIS